MIFGPTFGANNKRKMTGVCKSFATGVVVLALSACASQSPIADKSVGQRWVSTWGASPTVPAPNSEGFDNETLRLIVHATLGGERTRVRITNAFGAQPLKIGAASIAVSDTGANIVAGTSREVTFNGAKSVTIPPGALMVSDEVDLRIASSSNLAVSLYLPSNTGPVTAHPLATQTSFVSRKGNFIASNERGDFATQIQTWPFLAGLEVKANAGAHSVVTFGDSITDGYKSTIGENRRWPDTLARRLVAANKNIAVVNEGISGNRLLHDATGPRPVFGPNALSRFDRDVLAQSGVTHVIVLIGINDIGMGSRAPAETVTTEDIIAGLHQLIVRAHAKGLKIFGATLTPFEQAAYNSSAGEEQRQAVNRWIRTTKEFDGVIDFDQVVRDPSHPAQFLSAYDSGDHLHPSDAGYKAMGEAVDLKLFDR